MLYETLAGCSVVAAELDLGARARGLVLAARCGFGYPDDADDAELDALVQDAVSEPFAVPMVAAALNNRGVVRGQKRRR